MFILTCPKVPYFSSNKNTIWNKKSLTCCLALRAGPSFKKCLTKKNLFWNKKCKPVVWPYGQALTSCPWLTKKANLFLFAFFVSKSFFFSPFLVSLPYGPDNRLGFPKENLPGIPSLPFSAFFCLFLPFSKKKDEKGWKRMKKDGIGRDTRKPSLYPLFV